MEITAHLTESRSGIGHDGFGRFKNLARVKMPAEVFASDTDLHAGVFLLPLLHLRKEVAAVNEVEAVGFAAFLRRTVSADGGKGIELVT